MARVEDSNSDGRKALSVALALYRSALLGLVGVTLGLLAWEGERLVGRMDSFENSLNLTAATVSTNTNSIATLKDSDAKIWGRLEDHEHRITIIEAKGLH